MSEFNPLVERVDALLKRHQQQTAEVVSDSSAKDLAAPAVDAQSIYAEFPTTAADPAPVSADDDVPVLTEIVDPAAKSVPTFDHAALGVEIETAVLEKLLVELDRALEQRLGRTIADQLEQLMDSLRAELSISVRQMVREAVAASVARELAERARRP